jgi:hypothetical protein
MGNEQISFMVSLNRDSIAILMDSIINSNNNYAKRKLIDVLKHVIISDSTLCNNLVDIAIGKELPVEITVGTTVKIDPDNTGWLSSDDKAILQDNTTESEIYGVVKQFIGYHSYSNYIIAFKGNKEISLPSKAITSVKDVVI